MRRYDWILFDADNTLFDFDLAAKNAFKAMLVHFKIVQTPVHYPTYIQVNNQCWKEFEHGQITATELRTKRMEMFLNAIGEYRIPSEMNDYYLQKLSEGSVLIDGALDLINQLLAQQFKLAIITNGLKEVQRPRIAAANLTQAFETIVVSDEIGFAKPANDFFEYTFQQINHPEKTSALVVGDSLNSDIKGGNDFGVNTCWYNPKNKTSDEKIKPTYEIKVLKELIGIVFTS